MRKEIKKWQKVNSSETKAQLFEAVDYICADEPNGLVGVTGLLFDADKLKRSINAALSRRAEANVVTRRYGFASAGAILDVLWRRVTISALALEEAKL